MLHKPLLLCPVLVPYLCELIRSGIGGGLGVGVEGVGWWLCGWEGGGDSGTGLGAQFLYSVTGESGRKGVRSAFGVCVFFGGGQGGVGAWG